MSAVMFGGGGDSGRDPAEGADSPPENVIQAAFLVCMWDGASFGGICGRPFCPDDVDALLRTWGYDCGGAAGLMAKLGRPFPKTREADFALRGLALTKFAARTDSGHASFTAYFLPGPDAIRADLYMAAKNISPDALRARMFVRRAVDLAPLRSSATFSAAQLETITAMGAILAESISSALCGAVHAAPPSEDDVERLSSVVRPKVRFDDLFAFSPLGVRPDRTRFEETFPNVNPAIFELTESMKYRYAWSPHIASKIGARVVTSGIAAFALNNGVQLDHLENLWENIYVVSRMATGTRYPTSPELTYAAAMCVMALKGNRTAVRTAEKFRRTREAAVMFSFIDLCMDAKWDTPPQAGEPDSRYCSKFKFSIPGENHPCTCIRDLSERSGTTWVSAMVEKAVRTCRAEGEMLQEESNEIKGFDEADILVAGAFSISDHA